MSSKDKVNILLVDDQPGKLLSLEAIIRELDENILQAGSADEALKHLLSNDVAVVLVDVCMPKMDGFELAELIRGHPRFGRTAIIFISAVHLTDADRLKGYGLGAVDYISVPIVPDVLRAKVAIFADLHRKTLQLEKLNQELNVRVAERTIDLEKSAARLRESEDRFQQIAHTIDEVFWLAEIAPSPKMLYVSPAWERLWGRPTADAVKSKTLWLEMVHEDDQKEMASFVDGLQSASHEVSWDREYRIRRVDGVVRWVRERGRLLRGNDEQCLRAAGISEDITERKRAEEILSRDRETLERLVAERTVELEESNERLRLADRMATIGTLSAGLGHDMANLLLPMRIRLDLIERYPLAPEIKTDIAAIRKATEYLKRLASSLRLLAIDPEKEAAEDGATDISSWWADAEGMIRNAVMLPTQLSSEFAAGLPPVRIGKAALTQVILNLVQNAGDAMRGKVGGLVTVFAEVSPIPGRVRISVTDNGPGMNDETKRRCMEPFFTTKTRALSTGLGLALVSGILKRVEASIDVRSEVGKGTTFVLDFLATTSKSPDSVSGDGHVRSIAVVTLADPRLGAHIESVLSAMSFEVRTRSHLEEADVWITEARDDSSAHAVRSFASARPARQAVVVGCDNGHTITHRGVVCLESQIPTSELRMRIRKVLAKSPASRNGAI